jgi:hypothetical protein
MAPEALAPAGGDAPHNNMQPYLTFYFCIALQGVFPPRTREEGLSLALEVAEAVQLGLPPADGGGGMRRVTAAARLPGRRLLRSGSMTVGAGDLRPRLVRGIYFLGLGSGVFDQAVDTPEPGARVPSRMRSLVVSIEPYEPEL